MATIEELESLRWDLRRDCVDIIMAGAGGHIGGDMSVIDVLMTLYANHLNISPETVDDPGRDRFVLSKGHAMEAYYAVLCHEGYLDLDDVKARFSKFGSPYIGHPNNKLKGIEMNSGSLKGWSITVIADTVSNPSACVKRTTSLRNSSWLRASMTDKNPPCSID